MPPGRPSKKLSKSGARRHEELHNPPTVKMLKCDEPGCLWAYETRGGLTLHRRAHIRRRQRQLFEARAEALFRPQKRATSVEKGFSSFKKKSRMDSGEDKKEEVDDEDAEDEMDDEEVEEEEESGIIAHPAQHPTNFSSSARPCYSQRLVDFRPGSVLPPFFVRYQAHSVQRIFNATPTATQAMAALGRRASEFDPVASLPPIRSQMVSAGLLQGPSRWTDEPRNMDDAYQPQADTMPHSPFQSTSTTPNTATPNTETYSSFLAAPDHARTTHNTNIIYPSSPNFRGSTGMRLPQQVTAAQASSAYSDQRQWEQQPEFNYFEGFSDYESPSPTPSSSTHDSSRYYLPQNDSYPSVGLGPSPDPNYSAPPLTMFTSPISLLQPSTMYQPRWLKQEYSNAQGSMYDNTNDSSTSSPGAGPSDYYYQGADAYDSHRYTRN